MGPQTVYDGSQTPDTARDLLKSVVWQRPSATQARVCGLPLLCPLCRGDQQGPFRCPCLIEPPSWF
jgi:hypothetical protein